VNDCERKSLNRQPSTVNQIFLFILILLIQSCSQSYDTPSGDLNGVYSGSYTQTGAVIDNAFVKLVFVGSNFSGDANDSFRSVCNGSYEIIGDSIKFKNYCITPGSQLLLAGNYKFRSVGDSIYFSRHSPADTLQYTELFSLQSQ
jgi:hypothetical protein